MNSLTANPGLSTSSSTAIGGSNTPSTSNAPTIGGMVGGLFNRLVPIGASNYAPEAAPTAAPNAAVSQASPADINTANSQPMPNYSGTGSKMDISQYLPLFNKSGMGAPSSLGQKSFSINPGNTVSSSSLSPAASSYDAQVAAAKARQAIFNGTAPAGQIPSDGLLQSVIGQLFNASQYSPQEQQALGQYNDVSSQILQAQLAQRRQVQKLQEDGSITKEQGQAFIDEANRVANTNLANLATQQSGAALSLNTLGMIRQNQLGALQNISGFLKPTEVSPGSSLINSFGGVVGQASGASPQTVLNSALQMWQVAQTSGTATYNPDGSPNLQPFIQAAQQYYGGGMNGLPSGQGMSQGAPGVQGTQGGMQGGQNVPQVEGQAPGFGANGYGNVQMIPQQFKQYVLTTPIGGQNVSFIDGSRVPTALQGQMKTNAASAGIPYFDSQDGVKAAYAAQQILDIADAAKALSVRNLKPGTGGRIANTLTNWANNFLQFNPDLSNFTQLRDAASKATTALAGGVGSGFRMNSSIIDAAVQNLPTASDNLETAMTKSDSLASQIINGLSPIFPQLAQSSKYGALLQSQYGQGASGTSNPFSSDNFFK